MKKGFTLIELAIMLVVVGIILGLVVNGRTVIEAIQVKAEVYKLQKIRAAYATFVSKYGRLPGEIVNPEMFGETYDAARYGTKEAMDELINEGILSEKDFTIDLLDGAYWNIMGCTDYTFQSGVWLDLPPYLSRNICVYPSKMHPSQDHKATPLRGETFHDLKLICIIESHIDDFNIQSGLGRIPEYTNANPPFQLKDFSDCYSVVNDPMARYNYFFKVF